LPVIFLVENNGYGLSTPSKEQFVCKNFVDKGIGYGMETELIDGITGATPKSHSCLRHFLFQEI
jgi:TPP-dependent pyruvate/acetoin dehydrogenase alpha subunit